MQEQWIKWEPIKGLAEKYYVDGILDTKEGFKIILADYEEKNTVLVIFENSVFAYRSTDETFRHKLICDLDDTYNSDFYGAWTFFKVTNSLYIQWISEQSYGISNDRNLIHFSFIGANEILDVINDYEPKVEIIKNVNIS